MGMSPGSRGPLSACARLNPMPRTPANNLLLTGRPGCGKTTVVQRVLERISGQRLAGFYTREIREQGRRVGFEAVGLGGSQMVLAHVEFNTDKRVGRYGVDVNAFDGLVRTELGMSSDDVDLFVLDEIGKMECFSRVFIESTIRVLDGPSPVLATIAARGGGFISQVKARGDIEVFSVTVATRDGLPERLAERLLLG